MVAKRTQRDDEDCIEPRKTLPWRPRRCEPPQATCAGPSCEGPSLHRSLRRVRAVKDRVGTWETSGCPQPPRRSRAVRKARSRSRTGRSEESDGRIVPMKPRTTPADGAGGGEWEGRRPVEGRARANACSGHRAGTGMSPTACAHGSELDGPLKPRMPVASDLRQEPGAGKPHAGTARGAGGTPAPYRDMLYPSPPPGRSVKLYPAKRTRDHGL